VCVCVCVYVCVCVCVCVCACVCADGGGINVDVRVRRTLTNLLILDVLNANLRRIKHNDAVCTSARLVGSEEVEEEEGGGTVY